MPLTDNVMASIELEGYLVQRYDDGTWKPLTQPRLYDFDPQPLMTDTSIRQWFEPIEDEL